MIIQVLGVGGWQIALIVSLAMTTALLLDQGNLLVTQAAVQAVVVATLLPYPGQPSPDGPTPSSVAEWRWWPRPSYPGPRCGDHGCRPA